MSSRGNVRLGKCLSGEMSSRESVSRGIVLGEVSVGELSAYRQNLANIVSDKTVNRMV